MIPAYPVTTHTPPAFSFSPNSNPSPQPSSPPPRRHPKRRRLGTPRPKDPREEVIGSVLSTGKFTCWDRDCEGSTFGRLADLRRHYDHMHAKTREEYYCKIRGCARADKNTGGKGRSFGGRKDKRDEHMRNVHVKTSKKRLAAEIDDDDDDDDKEDEES